MVESFDILEEVKKRMGLIGNNSHDVILSGYVEDTKAFMIDAGVSPYVVESGDSIGVIARGVSDLWNYGSGGTDFSPFFIKRVVQLVGKSLVKGE